MSIPEIFIIPFSFFLFLKTANFLGFVSWRLGQTRFYFLGFFLEGGQTTFYFFHFLSWRLYSILGSIFPFSLQHGPWGFILPFSLKVGWGFIFPFSLSYTGQSEVLYPRFLLTRSREVLFFRFLYRIPVKAMFLLSRFLCRIPGRAGRVYPRLNIPVSDAIRG